MRRRARVLRAGGVATSGVVAPAQVSDFMLISAADLASRPTSGSPYTTMVAAADAWTPNLTTPTTNDSPLLVNDSGKAAEALANALVYARTGNTAYKTKVEDACRHLIGTEEGPHSSDNGTIEADYLLGTGRQLPGWIMAADLVGMNPHSLGSRTGWTTTEWGAWLLALLTKVIGPAPQPHKNNLTDGCDACTNHSTWYYASRVAIDIYAMRHGTSAQQTTGSNDLALAVDRVKLYTGEISTGTAWLTSNSFDATWACTVSLPGSVAFIPINSTACGDKKDGVIVEDASRSASAFTGASNGSDWDDDGIDYSWHALSSVIIAAQLLARAGYSDVWSWGNQAFKRAADRMQRLATEKGVPAIGSGNGRVSQHHATWLLNEAYGTAYPTVAPSASPHSLSWTDWLWP